MKTSSFTYVFIFCLTLTLFLKVSNVFSYVIKSASPIENVASNDDATEKEEKKVETEYFTSDFFFTDYTPKIELKATKLVIALHFDKLSYFPEVLTPPPSV